MVIRREDGEPNLSTSFPATASVVDMVQWCEKDGYKVIGHEIIVTPQDPEHLAQVIITVQRP